MVATKRAAAVTSPPAKPAKKAATRLSKAASPRPPPKSAFEEACEVVFGLLDDHAEMGETARTMLRNAAPLALRVPDAERHRFQKDMVASLADALDAVRGQKQKAVDDLTKKCEESAADKERNTEELKAATEAKAALTVKRDDAKAAMAATEADVTAASEALEAEKAALATLREANEKDCAKKTQMDKLISETFESLKAGNMGGQHWRARKRMIDETVQVLGELEVEQSIQLALPVAFKAKVQDRGVFAQKAIEFADEALKEAMAAILAKHASFEGEVSKQEAQIQAKETGLGEARAAREQGEADYVASENALLAGDEAATQQADAVAKSEAACEALGSSLAGAQAKLDEAAAILERFQALAANGEAAAAPEAAAEEEAPVAEAPMEVCAGEA